MVETDVIVNTAKFLIGDLAFHIPSKRQVTIEGAWVNDSDYWVYVVNPALDMVPETDLLRLERAV
jgi:hypothetical protein